MKAELPEFLKLYCIYSVSCFLFCKYNPKPMSKGYSLINKCDVKNQGFLVKKS